MPEGQSFREALEADIFDDAFPISDEHNKKTNDVIYHICNSGDGVAYTDLTGKFPYCFSRGSNYIMVAYTYDGNAILAEPVKIDKLLHFSQLGQLSMKYLLRQEYVLILMSWTTKSPTI